METEIGLMRSKYKKGKQTLEGGHSVLDLIGAEGTRAKCSLKGRLSHPLRKELLAAPPLQQMHWPSPPIAMMTVCGQSPY
ncbi:hypothetical protein L1049_009011 [Liquidambar formosana]|uniref:Uncharacterized protein n=1 Tax=Liquidambar formosana TaxID=63359 RepID=A0AAP0S774_LIQFO